jgi:predicted kinase
MSGLPGVGKSAIADELGRLIGAAVVSVDPIEAAILQSGVPRSFETSLAAYNVGAVVAEHQLRLGLRVIADAANYLEVGRDIWRRAAERAGTQVRVIDVRCSDEDLHRDRLLNRRRQLDLFPEPSWDAVLRRRAETEPWDQEHLRLDSVDSVKQNVTRAAAFLSAESTR